MPSREDVRSRSQVVIPHTAVENTGGSADRPLCAQSLMDFLQDDELHVLEAALSFVDGYSLEDLAPDAETSTAAAPNDANSAVKAEQSSVMLNGGPTFAVPCKETAAMVPLTMKNLLNGPSSGLKLHLPTHDEPLIRLKSTKGKKTHANPNRVRDEAHAEGLEGHGDSTKTAAGRRTTGECSTKDYCKAEEEDGDGIKCIASQTTYATGNDSTMLGSMVVGAHQFVFQGVQCLRSQNLTVSEHRTACVLDFQGDIGDFHDLFQHLQSAYHEIDTVFAASGLSTMDIPTNDVHVREGVDGKYIEIFANKLLPFSLRDTGEAAWNHFKGVEKHFDNGGLYEKAAKVSVSVTQAPDVKAKQILQRVVGPDRDTILFVSSVTPVEIKHKPLDGLEYHAREYVLTKHFPHSTPEHELSLLQLYVRVSFDYDPGVVYDSRHVRSVAQFVIGNVGGSLRCYQERIENALIDQALRRH
ncbi:unnamed protein product [Phytophthora lilii]|uniref:Unnamed protein product n=1 Tax=Phytophthora lilii TaxID=2077276 RepID=A0A9W6TXR2_9STRA|nr:unnamed protein product [Phytophthora lilii]